MGELIVKRGGEARSPLPAYTSLRSEGTVSRHPLASPPRCCVSSALLLGRGIDNTYYTYYYFSMRDKDLLKFFLQNGWKLDRINGSHHILKKDDKTEIIPVHGRDIPKGLLNAILKRNGFKI